MSEMSLEAFTAAATAFLDGHAERRSETDFDAGFRWVTGPADEVLDTPRMRVAGGTDEVMHIIVGERVLSVPKGPRTN